MLKEAIKNLTERERLIISLYYYENLNYKEIAEALEVSVSRISQLHSKVMNKLKEILLNKSGTNFERY